MSAWTIALRPPALRCKSAPKNWSRCNPMFALQRETQMIPIVFVNVSDPIGAGFVKSLARQ